LKYPKEVKDVIEKEIVVKNPHGLHARPAAVFVQKAAAFPCKITISKNGKEVDAKSILAVMSLGIEPNEAILLRADGEGEEEALIELAKICEDTEM